MKTPLADNIKVTYFAQIGGGSIFKKMTPSAVWSLHTLYEYIRTNPAAKKATEYLRTLIDEDEQKQFKAHYFDMVNPAGIQDSRVRGKNAVVPNGECCIDVDHIPVALRESLFQNLIDDENLTIDLMFRSPRGHGLKIFLRYNPEEVSYKKCYLSVSNYLLFTYGVMADKACSDITHACLIPWDENVYINPALYE